MVGYVLAHYDVFVQLDVERISELLSNTYAAEPRIACLQLHNGSDQFW